MSRSYALSFALVAALAASGCHRGRSVRGVAPTIPRALVRVARTVLASDCPRIDQVLYVLPTVVQVRACGRRSEYQLVGRPRSLSPITSIETRAAVQMACPAAQLEIESPAPAVRAVSGCGRRARYDLLCNVHGTHCGWAMTAHTGRWALVGIPDVPEQFDIGWSLPPEVEAAGNTARPATGAENLGRIALPPPPEDASSQDEAPFIPPPPAP